MFQNRRPGLRFNRGRSPSVLAAGGAPAPPPSLWTPADITSVAKIAWLRADLGVTQSGGTVSAWVDQFNGHVFAQATANRQPAFSATSGPNSTAMITGDGVDDWLACLTLALPAPGTTPAFFWMILDNLAAVSGQIIMAGDGATLFCLSKLTVNNYRLSNGVNVTAGGLVVGQHRLQALLSGGATDSSNVRAVAPTVGAFGNNATTQLNLFARGASGTSPAQVGIAELLITAGVPTEPELESTYGPGRYGSVPFT